MKTIRPLFVLSLMVGLSINLAYALKKPTSASNLEKEQALRSAIENCRFVFQAHTAQPLAWQSVNLDFGFYLKVSPDTVQAYLPYYGRAYKAPFSTDESGIKFSSKDFAYQVKEGKKGRLDISIKPNDLASKNYVLYLSVFPGGNCSLAVQDPDRQHIHFNGVLELPE